MIFWLGSFMIFFFFNAVFLQWRMDANRVYGSFGQAAGAGLLNSAVGSSVIFLWHRFALGGDFISFMAMLFMVEILCATLAIKFVYGVSFRKARELGFMNMLMTFLVSGCVIAIWLIICIVFEIKKNGLRLIPFM